MQISKFNAKFKIFYFVLLFGVLILSGGIVPTKAVSNQTLRGSSFSDDDPEDSHRASQWQISRTSGNYNSPVVDTGTDTSNKTSYVVSGSSLSAGTTYYWRVRYQDNHQTWSDWSSEKSFATEAGTACQDSGQNCALIVEPPIDGTTDETTDETTGDTTDDIITGTTTGGGVEPPGVIIDPKEGLKNQEQPFTNPSRPDIKLKAESVKDNQEQAALLWSVSDLPSETRNLIAVKKSREADWFAAVSASQTIQFFKIAESDGKIFDNIKIADLQEIYPSSITRPRLEILSQDSQGRWHLSYQDGKKIYYTVSDDANGNKWSIGKEVFADALPVQKSLNLLINGDNQPLIFGLGENSKSIVQINPQDSKNQIIYNSESSLIDYLSVVSDASGKNIYFTYLVKGLGEHEQPREIFYSISNNSQQKINISDSTWLHQPKLLKTNNKNSSSTESLPGIKIYRDVRKYYLINFDASLLPGGLNILSSKTTNLNNGWQNPELVIANTEEKGLKGGTDFDGVLDEKNQLILGWTGFNDKKVYLRRRETFGKWSDIIQIGEAKSRFSAIKLAAGSTLVAFDDDFYLVDDNNKIIWRQNRPIYPINYWEIYLDKEPVKKVTTATAVQTVLNNISPGKHQVQLKLVFQNGEILTSNIVEIKGGGKKIIVSVPITKKGLPLALISALAFLSAAIFQWVKWWLRWLMAGNSHPWSWVKMYLSHFLALFGWRRRGEPWGKVIDTGSEKPIPLVSVSLIETEMKRVIANVLTEPDGLFVFTPVEKSCFLTVGKQGYQRFQSLPFSANQSPNSLIKLSEDKLFYQNLQWVSSLRIMQTSINWLTIVQWLMFAGGLIMAVISFIQQQTFIEYAILILYFILVFWEIYRLFFQERSFGQIIDGKTRQPVAFAILRLFNSQGNLVATEVTDRLGRYNFLIKHGQYTLECGKPEYETTKISLDNPSKKIRTLIRKDIQLKPNG